MPEPRRAIAYGVILAGDFKAFQDDLYRWDAESNVKVSCRYHDGSWRVLLELKNFDEAEVYLRFVINYGTLRDWSDKFEVRNIEDLSEIVKKFQA